MKIDPKTQDKFFNVLKAVVIPRPIAFISSQSKNGVLNLAPFSFFNGVCYDPPTVSVAIGRYASKKPKDSLLNIEETGEFVINLVNRDMAEGMNQTAAEYPSEMNEFELGGFTAAPSERVKAPRVVESPVSLECKLIQVVPVNEGSQKECGLVLAEVVYCHIKDELFDGRYVDMKGLDVIGRLGGHDYCELGDFFEMKLPPYKPEGE